MTEGGIFACHKVILTWKSSFTNSSILHPNALHDSIMHNSIISSCKVKIKSYCNEIKALPIFPPSHSCHPVLCQSPLHPLHHHPLPVAHDFRLPSGLWYTGNLTILLPLDWPAQWPSNIPYSILPYPFEMPFPLASTIQMLPILKLKKPISSMKPPSPATLAHCDFILLCLPTAFTTFTDYLALYYLELLFNLSCIWVLRTC